MRPRPRRPRSLAGCSILVVVGVAALALSGVACGGASDDRLSEREWRQQANSICERGDRRIHALGAATTLEEVSRVTARTAEIAAEQLRALRRLRPPESREPAIAAFLERLAAHVAGVRSLAAAAAAGDWRATDRAGRALLELGVRSDRLARDLGLPECLSNDG